MVAGTAIVCVSMLTLGFTRELVTLLFSDDDERIKRPTIFLAVLAIYCVDFAINAGMSTTILCLNSKKAQFADVPG